MKSKVFTSVIFCLLLISNIYAEMIIKVEPMVVTAKKYASSLEETGSNVQVFTREELTQLGAETLKEAMDLSTNIASVSGGGVTSILQRGLASNASKVLWNGVELKDPITPQGTPYLDVLNINDLERIEIIQGASSSLYGSGAMGGVINFIFRKNVSNVFVNYATEKMVTGLNYNTYILDTDLQLNVSSSYDNTLSDLVDTTEKDAKTVQNIRLGVQRDFGRIRTKVLYARNLGVFELDNFFSTVDDPDYQLNSLQNLFSVSTAFKISENLESTLIYNLNSIARDSVNVADDVDATATSSEYRGSTNYVDWRNLWEVSSDINVLFGADLHTENGSSEYITAFYESTFANKAQSVRGAYT
ncbi:TonB-dependent receptor plug domain-containing protein, partial [bacterium]|nr:TonB-dependent receptor plug domain-containing protein [bacterium]